MSLTAKQRRDLLYGILAQGGDLGELDLHVELGKAESFLAGMDAQNKSLMAQKMAQINDNLPMGGTMPPPSGEMQINPSEMTNTGNMGGGQPLI